MSLAPERVPWGNSAVHAFVFMPRRKKNGARRLRKEESTSGSVACIGTAGTGFGRGEGFAATAAGGRIGIANHKGFALQGSLKIHLGILEHIKAHGIDKQLHALRINHGIIRFDLFIKGKTVLEAGATATGYKDTQVHGIVTLRLKQTKDFTGCGFG